MLPVYDVAHSLSLGSVDRDCSVISQIVSQIFLTWITDYAHAHIEKHLINSGLPNSIAAIFLTYLLPEKPTPKKVIKYLHFILFRYTVVSKTPTSSIDNRQTCPKSVIQVHEKFESS